MSKKKKQRKLEKKCAKAAGECPGGKKCREPKRHLCRLAKEGDLDALRDLARGAAFLCAKCGRAAASARNLCKPVAL